MTSLVSPKAASAPDLDTLPGIDIVFPTSNEANEVVLTQRTLKLIGSLHRRFWDRRRTMLQTRALNGGEATTIDLTNADYGHVAADLRQVDIDWDSRLGQFIALNQEIEANNGHSGAPTIRVRGWNDTEAGVLVDGRAVPGCVFDVAIAMSQGADLMRSGEHAFVINAPQAADDVEQKLWLDLMNLAEDRTGIERGTVTIMTICDTDELAVA